MKQGDAKLGGLIVVGGVAAALIPVQAAFNLLVVTGMLSSLDTPSGMLDYIHIGATAAWFLFSLLSAYLVVRSLCGTTTICSFRTGAGF